MIKVTCKDGIEPVKSEYPCLKITKSDTRRGFPAPTLAGRIVLFIDPKRGFELEGGAYPTDFHYFESWAEEDFKPYTGTIELSNEL